MNNNTKTTSKPAGKPAEVPQKENVNTGSSFTLTNYIIIAIGILLLGIGYILLSGGGSDDPNVFNEAMFDSRRLVVAPIVITLGLVVEICGIMFRSKK